MRSQAKKAEERLGATRSATPPDRLWARSRTLQLVWRAVSSRRRQRTSIGILIPLAVAMTRLGTLLADRGTPRLLLRLCGGLLIALLALRTYRQGTSYTGAEEHLRIALAKAPDSPDIHNYLAIALVYQGRLIDAEQHLTAALRVAPQHAVRVSSAC